MAEATSRRRTLGAVGMALLHKFPSQQAMAPPHAMLDWQPLVTVSKPAKHNGKTLRNQFKTHYTKHYDVHISHQPQQHVVSAV